MKKFFGFLFLPKKSDRWLTIAVLALALLGVVMSASAAMGDATIASDTLSRSLIVARRGAIFFAFSYVVMLICSRLPVFTLFTNQFSLLLGALVILGLLLLPRILGISRGGSYAWIPIPLPLVSEVTIQPAEFAKIFIMLVVAGSVGGNQANLKPFKLLRFPILCMVIYFFIIALVQKDFGTALVFASISYATLLIPANPRLKRLQFWLKIAFFLVAALLVFICTPQGVAFVQSLGITSYQIDRIIIPQNPFADRHAAGYQLVYSLIAFSNGGWLGTGLGRSLQKFGYLPESLTDFILAIIAEELGLLGVLAVFILFGLIIFRLLKYAFQVKNEKGKIILFGTAAYFFLHFLLNVGGITALIPLTGVPLLLVSYGGSSTLAAMVAIAFCQRIIADDRKGKEDSS
ncbi:MAG: FtsW/RodA/SpoVE family cell cycle protein [Erysipelotrichaceae bacterium]|jgi:cell division protein FtsW|nr:FtsW/RodA/SpoVE family cell cycle protein [Erysipelotrichaceae bacterium]